MVSEEGYGNPDTDLCMNAKKLEDLGIRTVVISDEAAGTDGKSQGLADATPEMTAFISTGKRERDDRGSPHGAGAGAP